MPAQRAVAEADGRRVRGTTDGHGDAATDAVAAVGPRAAGTALGQVAQEGGVGDGRGRVILESETAADAIATGLAAGPGAADCRVTGQRAVAERDTPAVAQDAAADASAAGAAAGLVVDDLAGGDVQRALVVDAAAGDGGVAADGAVGQRGRAATLDRPPPLSLAELPLTVQLVSVAVHEEPSHAAAAWLAELPLTVQLVSVAVPPMIVQAAAAVAGGVAADGAVGQRGRAAVRAVRPPPKPWAELPLMVQLVSVVAAEVVHAAAG